MGRRASGGMAMACAATAAAAAMLLLGDGASAPLAAAATAATTQPAAPPKGPAPLSEVAQRMTVPPGFKVTLFAGEPDLVQPINFTLDERGRLWVCENFSYPDGKLEGTDRIAIFEDADGDGRFDTKKVFASGFGYLTGATVGDGGVYVACAPWLLFIPDKDGDDVPDGPPVKLLDGWTWEGQHNVVNSLTWGPDGWLYGLHGITVPSKVGKVGSDPKDRVDVGPGVWRYHPRTTAFEFITEGTTNPWGIDFNEYGDGFITTSVTPHLYQVIHGAHFTRMHGQDFNRHVYVQMKHCTDHLHWAGGDWTSSRGAVGAHGAAGGGHSHAGLLIYQGTGFPAELRGSLFMLNIHGKRMNRDVLGRRGSGYVASHAADFLFANDPWFVGVTVHQAPDGGVYFSDWSDTGECHHYTNQQVKTGRLYKLTHERASRQPLPDLRRLSDLELAALAASDNEFLVRHARRLLTERRPAAGPEVRAALARMFEERPEVPKKLRALWALYCIGGTDEAMLLKLTAHADEHVRSWAVRLLGDHAGPASPASPAALARFEELAASDPSPMVRLWLASVLRKLPAAQRWKVLDGLTSHAEDAEDPYLPCMYWYALEPLVQVDAPRALRLAAKAKVTKLRELTARRVAAK